MKTPPPELRGLVDRLLDGQTLDRVEMARLEVLLENDEHLAYYIDLTQQEAALPGVLAGLPRPAIPVRRITLATVGTIAAAACAIFWLGFSTGKHRVPPASTTAVQPSNELARVTGLVGVRWSDPEASTLLSRSGAIQKLAIESGLAEITYASGVRVTIEGPAEFDVTDHQSGRLFNGKLVASVPKGAEGFRIDYADGTVVDLGTEFAMEATADGPVDIGVFNGEIELHAGTDAPMALYEGHAVRHDRRDAGNPVQAIPFEREKFVRQFPTRDFSWSIDSDQPRELVFDVTHLVWKASEYRAIFKWINGLDAILIEGAHLRRDGELVASDSHSGVSGVLGVVRDNVFVLDFPEDRFSPGRWTLHATVRVVSRTGEMQRFTSPIHSSGILQFEEGLVSQAGRADFIGRWSYHHLGSHFIREFHPDGTISLFRDGKHLTGEFVGSRWSVEDGVLRVSIPQRNAEELHVLRDRDTLVFISNPYENATRE